MAAAALAAAPSARAQDLTSQQVLDALATADGSVTAIIAGTADPRLVLPMMQAVATSPATDVRIGIAQDVPERQALLDDLAAQGAGRPGWQVCDQWLTPMAEDDTNHERTSAFLQDSFGGAIVILDNGPNDRDRFHPAIGDDPFDGQPENPILQGLFDPETPWGAVTEPDPYRAAWQTADGLPRGQDPNGC